MTSGGDRAPTLRAKELIPALTAGIVNGALAVVVVTSFAAFIFTGPLSSHLADGIGILLLAEVILIAVIALGATIPTTSASIQDSSAAILGVTAASIAGKAGATGDDAFVAVVLTIALTSIGTGVVFFLLGTLRLGDIVRFVPYPVVGGFLAGTGWLLTIGAIEVLAGVAPTGDNLSRFLEGPIAAKWVAGVSVALPLLIVTRRSRHPMILPAALVVLVGAFYAVVLAAGDGVAAAERGGWLLGPFPEGGLWKPWTATALASADWGVVGGRIVSMGTVVLVALLAFLLTATAVELALEEDVDVNRDLRAAGLANFLAGTVGGIPGFHTVTFTVIAHKIGARTRLAGLVAALVCGGALAAGSRAVSVLPRTILGGVLLFVGLSFLIEWLFDARRKLNVAEYLLVLLIVTAIAVFGYLPGVAVGLVAAVVLFAVAYARLDVVRHTLSGVTYQSRVERTPAQREALRGWGEQIAIMELQGFLFFGTVKRLLDRVTRRLNDPDRPPLAFLVLDFRRVTGHDSSAAMSFVGIERLAHRRDFVLVLTGLPDNIRDRFEHNGSGPVGSKVVLEPELDRGVQWCENQLLTDHGIGDEEDPQSLERELEERLGDIDISVLVRHLVRMDVAGGEEVIRQGDPADDIYFVESGRVTVELAAEDGSTIRLRTMGPGAVLGELPFYIGTERSASVVAETDCVVYRLPVDVFPEIERTAPLVAAALHRFFAQLLARRLADSLQSMQALLE